MVVHPSSHRVSRVRRYSGFQLPVFSFAYGTLTLCGRLSHAVLLDTSGHDAGPNPEDPERPSVWPPPRSLATTSGISVDVFSCPYLDVSVQGVPLVRFTARYLSIAQVCCHIRKSPDRSSFAAPRSLSQLVTSFIGS